MLTRTIRPKIGIVSLNNSPGIVNGGLRNHACFSARDVPDRGERWQSEIKEGASGQAGPAPMGVRE
jgi:hypothetical protein